ncbi:MAG: hypothetical protein K9K66_14580 [Desulfarculaceae bacterium]|nr:hypothetical protein [Desulfarculaceae bacterium]MCF8102879.1 hypothetical protein [Desulfarculaceae bacterium]MCF8118461.1 hypothetical protein [Desulfarculaceae bacterium]
MCNWKQEAEMVAQQLGGAPVGEVFGREFLQRKDPLEVVPGFCLLCGQWLSYGQMHPPGRPPRYMCQRCYEFAMEVAKGKRCLTCGGELADRQFREFMRNPRELKNAFCREKCLDYHKVLAGRVLGIDFNINGIPRGREPIPVRPLRDDPKQIALGNYAPKRIYGGQKRRLTWLGDDKS